jgi:competence protein ComEA
MKLFGSHFYMSKPQRNALVILVILLLCVSYLKDFYSKVHAYRWIKRSWNTIKNDRFYGRIKGENPDLYPFNPNYLTYYRAYVLGLKPTSIDQLLNHRKSGKWMNNAAQFQSVAVIDDSLMALLKPYLIFPRIKKIRM